MPLFSRSIDFITLGSDRPIRRLLAYYTVLAGAVALLVWTFPGPMRDLLGAGVDLATSGPVLLQDGMNSATPATPAFELGSLGELILTITFALLGSVLVMLPVSWVYMSARNVRGHSQAIVQALIILPIVVAGIVFVVRNSLALAFSLAGVFAAIRWRTTLRDQRDVVFVFLAIAVGFATGVQMLAVGALVSIIFNFLIVFNWRYDFGRNVLAPTASSQWSEPLSTLVDNNGHGRVPDRDLVLALTPGKAQALAERFNRVRNVLGSNKKKPRFNAVLTLTSHNVGEAQVMVQKALDEVAKRWELDEVVTHTGKPSEIYYLLRLPKSTTRDEVLTAVRSRASDRIVAADLEIADTAERAEDGAA